MDQGCSKEILGFSIDFEFGDVVELVHSKVMIYLIAESSGNTRQAARSSNQFPGR